MRFISFFAGIGGIDLGLERAGHECVGQCEIDPYAIKVLEKHWPDVPRFGDITKVKPDELPEAELWAGGFPCQDISTAGKQRGIHGERSGLFFDFMLLAAQVRPRFLLLENVRALIDGAISDVLGTLAEVGYDAEWQCIPASAVGAHHLRDRAFILAYPRGFNVSGRGILPQNGRQDTFWQEKAEEWGINRKFPEMGTEALSRLGEEWKDGNSEPPIPRIYDGIPRQLDRIKGCGNAVVPQVAEYIGRILMEASDE